MAEIVRASEIRDDLSADVMVIDENLDALQRAYQRLEEKSYAHLQEKLRILTHHLSKSQLRELVCANFKNEELYRFFKSLHITPLSSTKASDAACYADLSLSVRFCRSLCAYLWDDGDEMQALHRFLHTVLASNQREHVAAYAPRIDGAPRVACVQSVYSDRALETMFSKTERIRTIYGRDFQQCCEMLSQGEADYCLLPLENSANGFLTSFYRLIDRYGLHVVCSCNMVDDGADGGMSKMALLAEECIAFRAEAQRYCLDLSVSFTEQYNASLLIDAARLCGLQLRRADGIGCGDELSHYLSFWATGQGALVFLVFLLLYVPQFYIVGLYPSFSQEK